MNRFICFLIIIISLPAYAGQLKDVVADYGAIPNDGLSDLTAFQSACTAAVANEAVLVPPGNYDGVNITTFTCSKNIRWIADGARNSSGTSYISLPGIVETTYNTRKVIRHNATNPDDHALLHVLVNTNHSGGTPGYTTAPVRVETTVNSGVSDNYWGVLSTLDNYNDNGTFPTALYSRFRGYTGTGWGAAAVLNYSDMVDANNPTAGQVTLELDHEGVGTDNSGNGGLGSKVLLSLAAGNMNAAGRDEVGFGIWATCFWNDDSLCKYKRVLTVDSPFTYGLDTSMGTQDAGGAAIKMKEGQSIILGNTSYGKVEITLDSANRKILFKENGVTKGHLTLSGSDHGM